MGVGSRDGPLGASYEGGCPAVRAGNEPGRQPDIVDRVGRGWGLFAETWAVEIVSGGEQESAGGVAHAGPAERKGMHGGVGG